MAININAKTSGVGGLETTADNSGNINIQSGGSTVMSVTSSGVAVTGSFSQNGAVYSTQPTFRNLIINGDMRIDQRNGGSAVAMAVAYTLDRWLGVESTDGGCNVQQVTDAPANATHSLKVSVTSTDTSLAAAQYMLMRQIIEGNNIAHLGWGTSDAKAITISFWVKSSVTGTYAVTINNSAYNRGYVATYTISSANTWEYKTVTIAGDTTGTWNTDNTSGIVLNFGLGTGTDHQNTADSWVAGYGFGTASTTNLMATSGATWQVSLVQLEVGSTATDFENLPYDVQLQRCKRYYWQLNGTRDLCAAMLASTVSAYGVVTYPVEMRTSPTLYVSATTVVRVSWSAGTSVTSGFSVDRNSPTAGLIRLTTSGLTAGQGAWYLVDTGSLSGSAEL